MLSLILMSSSQPKVLFTKNSIYFHLVSYSINSYETISPGKYDFFRFLSSIVLINYHSDSFSNKRVVAKKFLVFSTYLIFSSLNFMFECPEKFNISLSETVLFSLIPFPILKDFLKILNDLNFPNTLKLY